MQGAVASENVGKYLEITWSIKEKQALWSRAGWGAGGRAPRHGLCFLLWWLAFEAQSSCCCERPGWAAPRSLVRGRVLV